MLFCFYLAGHLFVSSPEGEMARTVNVSHIQVFEDRGASVWISTEEVAFETPKDPDVTMVDLLMDCDRQAEYDILQAYDAPEAD